MTSTEEKQKTRYESIHVYRKGQVVTRINKYSEIGNVSAVKMESVIQ